jgi:hypothetical protein
MALFEKNDWWEKTGRRANEDYSEVPTQRLATGGIALGLITC